MLIGESCDVDIPNLSSEGIEFGDGCFDSIYSVQSSSMHSLILSFLDSEALETVIRSWRPDSSSDGDDSDN